MNGSSQTAGATLIIAADDYGYWPSYNAGILEAVGRGMVDSVGAMVERGHCEADPLLATGVEIGLHLEFEGRWGSRSGKAAQRSLEVQLDRFARMFGSWPAFIDGHHHCHARPEMLTHVNDRAQQLGIPVRSTTPDHRQLLRERGIATEDHLIGRLSPDEPLPDKALVDLPPGVTIWFVHPGYPDPESGSSYDTARGEDLDVLVGLSLRARIGERPWGDALRSTHAEAFTRTVEESAASE
ncbi:MAG: ChbG/HpnK family deacetylase [Solirubrobacterales bacterium]